MAIIFTRKSPVTGNWNSMTLDVTPEQVDAWANKGVFIQDAFPNLTAAEREFLISGCYGNDFDKLFPPEEE